jgi:hydrogenase-4 component F
MSLDPVMLLLVIPALTAAVLLAIPGSRASAWINAGASGLTFLAALLLWWNGQPRSGAYILVDEFNTIFLVLITFVSFTTSVFSANYVAYELNAGRVTPAFSRLYHALYQALTLAFNLALLSNNLGVLWVAIELATMITVVMVGIYRTHAAIEAAWKYFILASVGIALALFGTILVYMAGQPAIGVGVNAMVWTELVSHAARLDPAMLNLAFVFLLLGYGTKIGLFPLHAWLPDAHAEGPTPITAVLSGLLLNVALYALLRCKMLLAGNPEALAPGPLMIGMGLVTLLFGAFMLYRRRDIKRLFAYSSIEHMGIATFAFGIGGPLANFAGLLHMVLHSLTKSAIFFAVGDISQVKGTQKIAEMGGLTKTNPLIGWGLVIGVAAIAGLPPLGIFTSEFLTVSATLARQPWLAIPLVLGLLVGIGALFLQLNRIAFGEPKGETLKVRCSYLPMFVHLALVLVAGIYLPQAIVALFEAVAKQLG